MKFNSINLFLILVSRDYLTLTTNSYNTRLNMEPEEDLLDFMEKETGGSSLKTRSASMTFQEKLKADQAKNHDKNNDLLNKTNYGEDFNDLVTQMDHEGDLLGTQEGIQMNDSDDDNIDIDNVEKKNYKEEAIRDENKMEIESTPPNKSGQERSQKGPNMDNDTQNSNNITSGEERMAHLLDALEDLSQDIISTPAPIPRSINSDNSEAKNGNINLNSRDTPIRVEEDLDIGQTGSTKPDVTSATSDDTNTKNDINITTTQSQKSNSIQQRKIFKAKTKRAPNAIGPGSQDSQNEAFLIDNTSNNNMPNSDNTATTNRKKFSKQISSGTIQNSTNENTAQNQPVNNTINNSDVNNNNNINNPDGDTMEDVPPSTQSRALPIWFSSKTTIDKQTVTSTKERQKLKSDLRNKLIEGWKNEGFSFGSTTSSSSASATKGPSQAVIKRAPFCEITDDVTTIVKGRAVIFDLETSGT